MKNEILSIAEDIFMSGIAYGQAILEQNAECNSYADAYKSLVYAHKTGGGVLHNVSCDDDGRYVALKLRPEEWQNRTIEKSKKEKDESIKKLLELYV